MALFAALSKVYATDDFKPDFAARAVQDIIENDNVKIPSVKIIKFLSAYAYTPDYVVFTGQNLYIFINLAWVSELTELELKARITHEIGHYVLGHLNYNPAVFNNGFSVTDNFGKEIQADMFAAKYFGNQAVSSLVRKTVWNAEEQRIRLAVLEE